MTLADVSIRRPVLTWMMTLALVVFGVLAYMRLGVDHFPDMESPVVTVTALMEGGTPESMEEDVTDVLEEYLSTIGGVRSIRSSSLEDTSQVIVEFELGVDIQDALQEVRDKIGVARLNLPTELEPPVVASQNPAENPVLWLPISYGVSVVEASEYVDRELMPYLGTTRGVAGFEKFGLVERAIRIWPDPDALTARGLAASDIVEALRRDHVEATGGRLETGPIDYSLKTDAEFRSIAELETLVVAERGDAPILLRDVARVEDGAAEVETYATFNGEPTFIVGAKKRSGENSLAMVDALRERVEGIRPLLPEGVSIATPENYVDLSIPVRDAVAEARFALIFGALLAVFVVFVFLRRTRPTLIVAASIPVSLIASFALVWAFGFTLNTMTLLAMTLAVGVVIDDAIVVLENIERHREEGMSAREAASSGTREVAFAATAATLAVAVVFIPVVFVQGLVGSFLGEFGITVAGAVLISLFVALTLTPMLAARMPPPAPRRSGGLYDRLESAFERLERSYRSALGWTLHHRGPTLGFAALAIVAGIGLGGMLGTEFFPPSDMGFFYSSIQTPPGTSLETTHRYYEQVERWLLDQPDVATILGASGTDGTGTEEGRLYRSDEAFVFGVLQRSPPRTRSMEEIIEAAGHELRTIPGRDFRIFNPGNTSNMAPAPFSVELVGNRPLDELEALQGEFMERLEATGRFGDLRGSLELGLPELRIVPDRAKAAALGVDARSVAEAVRVMIGGADVAVFKEGGRRYDIRMRLEADERAEPRSVDSLHVRSRSGELVELRNVVSMDTAASTSTITRINRQRSAQVNGNIVGVPLGDAVALARGVAEEMLPPGVHMAVAGEARELEEGGGQLLLAIGLAILMIYMVLAAQFESLSHPLTVMLALPLSMVGALGGLLLSGNTLNLFSMIGILLLFGLVAKNSILLVDYANQLRERGFDKVAAIREAAPVRMRPVLMTALSMIFGVLPAALGVGPGAETRSPMAIATAAGMLSSTLLTLLLVPAFYLVVDDAAEWTGGRLRRLLRPPRSGAPPLLERRDPAAPVLEGERRVP